MILQFSIGTNYLILSLLDHKLLIPENQIILNLFHSKYRHPCLFNLMMENSSPSSHKSTSASSTLSDDLNTHSLFPDSHRFSIVKKLSEAKYPVYLVRDNKIDQLYAMKLFPFEENDQPTPFFVHEVRFSKFNHPNIISIVDYKTEQETFDNDCPKVSFILMEYAKYGDLFDALVTYKIPFNETLIRTYFHQLIAGLDVLHSKGAAHLDLKLENLLLDENYNLKLADFDLSYMPEDKFVTTRGTMHFRAPELLAGCCKNPQAADVYSLGIILFLLKTGGMIPYREDGNTKGINMKELQETNPEKFWEKQCELLGKKSTFFSEEFKSMFVWMTQPEPEKRPTLMQIKNSRWYCNETCCEQELFMFMNGRFEFL